MHDLSIALIVRVKFTLTTGTLKQASFASLARQRVLCNLEEGRCQLTLEIMKEHLLIGMERRLHPEELI